jgi:hypothetical protein
MGDEYQPSDRLRAALGELHAALAETDDSEVGGFIYLENLAGAQVRSFTHEHVENTRVGTTAPKLDRHTNDVFKF